MSKITFNKDLFSLIPSPKDSEVAFVFNRKDGSIFQVEGVTKEVISCLMGKKVEEKALIEDYARRYKMKDKDIKAFKIFFAKIKKNKVII